jgi:hypothetical protein
MFSRPMLFVSVLAAAVGVPYVLLDEHLAGTVRDGWDRLASNFEREETEDDRSFHAANYTPSSGTPGTNPPTPIEQIFRFDLTPRWVAGRWPRVSTVAGEDPDQLAMRVVLVSGTRPDDIAGSLTYYFDRHHQLQRITFSGLTRDPRRLLATVVTPYRLKSLPTVDIAHYVGGNPDEPTSEVIVRHMPVIVAKNGLAETEVEVDLSRGDAGSSRPPEQAEADRKILPTIFRRW